MLGEVLAQGQLEREGVPQDYKAEEMMDQTLVELEMHMMVADTLANLAGVGTLFEGLALRSCMTYSPPVWWVHNPLLLVEQNTETVVGHQGPDIQEGQQGCSPRVDSEDCKVVYQLQSLERNSWKNTDWIPLWMDIALRHMGFAAAAAMAASVFDIVISVVAVVAVQ